MVLSLTLEQNGFVAYVVVIRAAQGGRAPKLPAAGLGHDPIKLDHKFP
jgi:hypothetical protein